VILIKVNKIKLVYFWIKEKYKDKQKKIIEKKIINKNEKILENEKEIEFLNGEIQQLQDKLKKNKGIQNE